MFAAKACKAARYARPRLEQLEDRLALYSASGNLWARPELITLSFVPDNAVVGYDTAGAPILSNFQESMNNLFGDPSVWQAEVLRAAQAWAKHTNINFALKADTGLAIGAGLFQQGDSVMGDIRIGGYDFGTSTLAQSYLPPSVNNYSIAGDIQFNTAQLWNVGADYDLFTVANHEIGHALGLYHSSTITASMYSGYTTVKADLDADDIDGIKSIYSAGAARAADSLDAAASNGTHSTASVVSINATTKTATVNGLDLTTTSDVDWYQFTAPTGTTGTLTVKVQSDGLSLLTPLVQLYASNGTTLLASGTAAGDYDGATVSFSKTGITAGTVYKLKVSGAEAGADAWQSFNTGKYGLTLQFAATAPTALTMPNTAVANGNPLQGGGGQAIRYNPQFAVNTTTASAQFNNTDALQNVASDANGNFVVVWSSALQDGSSYGVYLQRYNNTGTKVGGEVLVNTYTSNEQDDPAVAMDNLGNFVVVWESLGQDGSEEGVYFQRFNASGVKQGSETRVNTTTAYTQEGASVAMDANGDFVVTWTSWDAGDNADIFMQRYNAAGTKQGSEVKVTTSTAYNQDRSAVAMDDAGNYVVVWSSYGQDGSGYGVYGQRYNAAGTKLGSEFRVSGTTTNDQDYASVATDASGDFVVTWSSYSATNGWDIYARRYDATGASLGDEDRINDIAPGDQKFSSVAMDQNGNILVTWQGYSVLSGWDIYGQQLTSSGARQGLSFLVSPPSWTGDQVAAGVAMSDNGKAVVVWSGNSAADSAGISGQMYLVNQGNGMSNMSAQPHGFGVDGCTDGCGHDHHHGEEESGDGCACATCATAAFDAAAPAAVAGVTSVARFEDMVGLLSRGDGAERRPEGPRRLSRGDAAAALDVYAADLLGALEALDEAFAGLPGQLLAADGEEVAFDA